MNHLLTDTPEAPWNDRDNVEHCPDCKSENIELFDSGKDWVMYKCNECSLIFGDEPEIY